MDLIEQELYNFYRDIAIRYNRNDWGIYKNRIYKNKKYTQPQIQFDNMWFQGM